VSPGEKDKSPRIFSSYIQAMRSAGPVFGSGIQLAASAVLMFFLGRWLDGKFNSTPWLMITGVFLGFGAGLYNFIKTAGRVDGGRKGGKEEMPK